MSTSNQGTLPAPVLVKVIDSSTDKFESSALSFEKEKVFAFAALSQNSYLQKVAHDNLPSLQIAMYNLAAVGLSLNPVTKFAYLLPRRIGQESRVILEISYQGLIEIAMQSCSIKSCSVTLVHEKDLKRFEWVDNFTPPRNPPNPFMKDKGDIVGGYCQVRLADGSFLLYAMNIDDILKRRDCSEMVKRNGPSGPWLDWKEEMIKKTIVKQAAKWWPSNGSTQLAEAQRVLNEDNGEGLPPEERVIPGVVEPKCVELPAPLPREAMSEKIVEYVDRAVNRAEQLSAWQTCEDHFVEKYKDLRDRSYALNVLLDRRAASETQIEGAA